MHLKTRVESMRIGTGLALLWCCFLSTHSGAQVRASDHALAMFKSSPLPPEQIIKNLEEKNAQRAAALAGFAGTRKYRMQYRGLPGDRDAEMSVNVIYHAPDAKQFSIVSQKGSKFIIDHVFKKLLEGEQEAANEQNRRRTALNRENYDFSLVRHEDSADGGRYVFELSPKTKNKFLYRGRVWIDATDFAVVRMEGEPGKNPSFWIKKTEIVHKYTKVNEFWLPAENHTESVMRLGGRAILSIKYEDYKITRTSSAPEVERARQKLKSDQLVDSR